MQSRREDFDEQQAVECILEHSGEVLNNPDESFKVKIECVLNMWEHLKSNGLRMKIENIIKTFDWVKLHTLHIVMNENWKRYARNGTKHFVLAVRNCGRALYNLNNTFNFECQKLIKIIQQPWDGVILKKLLKTSDVEIGNEEVSFFMDEPGNIISLRLEKLNKFNCEDLALNLARSYVRYCEWAELRKINLDISEEYIYSALDVYLVLLYKYKMMPEMITQLSKQSLEDGLDLVYRFSQKDATGLWEDSALVAHKAAVIFCTKAVAQPIEESRQFLVPLIDIWFHLDEELVTFDMLMASTRKMLRNMQSVQHIYHFCDALNKISNSTPRIASSDQQIVNQIMSPVRTTATSLKLRTSNQPNGKLIPISTK